MVPIPVARWLRLHLWLHLWLLQIAGHSASTHAQTEAGRGIRPLGGAGGLAAPPARLGLVFPLTDTAQDTER